MEDMFEDWKQIIRILDEKQKNRLYKDIDDILENKNRYNEYGNENILSLGILLYNKDNIAKSRFFVTYNDYLDPSLMNLNMTKSFNLSSYDKYILLTYSESYGLNNSLEFFKAKIININDVIEIKDLLDQRAIPI